MTFKPSSLAILIVLFISALGAWAFNRNGYQADRTRLQEAALEIEQRIEGQISFLHAARGLFLTVGDIDRTVFRNFVEASDVLRRAPGMRGVGFAIRMRPDEEDAIAARLQRDYGVRRDVWPDSPHGLRYPIVLLEPDDDRNREALGYDMFSEANRREAMIAAWRSRGAAASRMVTLVQETGADAQHGFLIYLPFFVAGNIGGAPDGFVYAPFRVGDLVRAMTPVLPGAEIAAIYADRIADDSLLYGAPGDGAGVYEYPIKVGGRDWIVLLRARHDRFNPWRVASLLSILAGAMTALFFWRLMSDSEVNIRSLRALADERKARAELKDIHLKEMNHRLKNLLSRIVSMARLSARSAGDVNDFVRDFSRRLEAMSRAHDMLAASSRDRAALAALIREEINLMVEPGDRTVSLAGPDTELNESQTQALGLVIHELATNAAKYGAFHHEGGEIDVVWTRTPGPDAERLRIRWRETGFGAAAPRFDREGFGTRLARMMVEGQLGGAFSRRFEAGALEIDITFPLA